MLLIHFMLLIHSESKRLTHEKKGYCRQLENV